MLASPRDPYPRTKPGRSGSGFDIVPAERVDTYTSLPRITSQAGVVDFAGQVRNDVQAGGDSLQTCGGKVLV